MAGIEPAVAEEWLDGLLNGDATLTGLVPSGAWNAQADEGTAFPLIVYQMMSGIDLAVVGAVRIWTNLIYQVKVIGQTANYAALNAAVARIDTLLHRASGSAADGTVWACVREQTIRLPDSVAGKQFRHAGATYRIYAS